jgi:hypothetical protein
MSPRIRAQSPLLPRNRVAVVFALTWLATGLLSAQGANARYVGGTLSGEARITQYKCGSNRGTLDTTSGSDLVFKGDGRTGLVVGYGAILSLGYGVDSPASGPLCYPWDSYEQFTKKRHYVLTIVFRDDREHEQAAVFEVDKTAVRSTLAALEARSGRQVGFADAVACIEYKTAAECGHGQPSELNGLAKLFVDTRDSAARDRITSEIAASKLGLTLVGDAQTAEIILRYTGGFVEESGGSFRANGGRPMSAGRGEVRVVREGHPRVVLTFEDVRMSALEKEPATRFCKTFVEAYRQAKLPMK